MDITTNTVARLTSTLLAASLSACATTTPHWDGHFGDAARIVRAQQIANPKAALNTDVVNGIDARAARAVMERYERSFREPPAAPVLSIGVSTPKQ